jgi:hypothetical protein
VLIVSQDVIDVPAYRLRRLPTINDMTRNQELGERLSSNAIVFVSDFTWDKREKEYLSLVDRLVGQRVD